MTPGRRVAVIFAALAVLLYGLHLLAALAERVEGDPPQLYLLAWYVPFAAIGVGAVLQFFIRKEKP